jgi:hypothetical protein
VPSLSSRALHRLLARRSCRSAEAFLLAAREIDRRRLDEIEAILSHLAAGEIGGVEAERMLSEIEIRFLGLLDAVAPARARRRRDILEAGGIRLETVHLGPPSRPRWNPFG